jgi:hypothetical protein
MSAHDDPAIRFSQLAAEAIRQELHEDLKVRLDAQGAEAFDLAAREVEEYGALLVGGVPTLTAARAIPLLARRLRQVAADLRR